MYVYTIVSCELEQYCIGLAYTIEMIFSNYSMHYFAHRHNDAFETNLLYRKCQDRNIRGNIQCNYFLLVLQRRLT